MQLKGVKVLVTGGTSGIGLKAVEALLNEGAKVIVVARDEGKLAELKKNTSVLEAYSCDLANPDALIQWSQTLLRDHPDIQILINNAGIQNNIWFDDEASTPESIQHEISTNLISPLLLIRLLLPELKKQSEAIIMNVTTGLALVPKTRSAVYCGAKGGLRTFTQGLRNQLEGTSVRIIEVLPPVVETPMTEGRGKRKMSPDEVAKQMVNAIKGKHQDVYVGKTKLLFWLARISPLIARNMMKNNFS